jgi:hypothetical protein
MSFATMGPLPPSTTYGGHTTSERQIMMGKLAISLGAAAISLLLIGCAPQLDASLTELENGDCVKDPGPIFQVDSLEHVDCDGQAVLQVTSIFQIKGYDEWPGQATVNDIVDRQCAFDTTAALYPTEESWNGADDRDVVCFKDL